MKNISYFLEDIRDEGYRTQLSPEDVASLDKYLDEMAHGPANGGMDIDWMTDGLGYYIHEHIMYGITDQQERDRYLQKLSKDIDTWLEEVPNHYMVERVRDSVFKSDG